MTTSTKPAAARAPRVVIREWMADYAAAHPEIDRATIIAAASDHFAGDDFVDVILNWFYDEVIPAEASRTLRGPGRVTLAGGRSITRDELARRAATSGGTWARWRQDYVTFADDGTPVELPEMTREHLLKAAGDRAAVARDALIAVTFLKRLAGAVTGSQRVCDVFTPAELERVLAGAHQNIARRSE